MEGFRSALIEEIPRLRRFARGLTARPADADDLVQATLARALDKSESWEHGTNLRAWLFTILHNLFITDYRKEKRAQEWRNTEKLFPKEPNANEQESRIRLKEVEIALQRLPDDQRSVILMIALEGMAYTQVAEVLDIPVGTVRSRLSRGRVQLRRYLEESEDSVLRVVKP